MAAPMVGISADLYVVAENGCWLWQRYRDRHGYGRLKRQGQMWLAHRYSWSLANGPIGDGLTVDHLCFNPPCINPAHLRLLPLAENSRNQRRFSGPSCANGHPRTPDNLRAMTDRQGRSFHRCLTCERNAFLRNHPKQETSR